MLRGMIGLLCLLLAMAATDSPASAQAETTDPLAAAIAEAATAPDAALAELQSLRALPPPEGQRAAVAALRLLIQLKRLDEALALSDALLGDASLGANQKLDTISARLLLMQISKHWDDQERITALVDESLFAAANADSSARYYQELGGLRTIQMRLPEAETALIAGLAIAGDSPSERQAGLHRRLGVVYAQQGKYPEAIEHMQEVERIRTALGLPEDFSLLRNFGSLHVYLEDWDRAIAYLERAESALKAEKNPDARTFLSLYSTLAGAQTGAGRHAQAHATFDKAFALAAEHGIEDLALLNNRGFLYQRENRHREALPLFERALAHSADNRDPSRAGIFEKNIGESLLALGEKERALEFLERAERAQRESAPAAKRLELLPLLIDALEQNGRSAQALERMREFKRLNDEVVNAEAKERIARLESVVELERKERQLATSEQQAALQSAENEVLRAERQRQRLLIGGILAALLAFAVILALLVRDRRFKAAAQQELEARNARIEAQRRDLESLNEALHRQSREDALTGLNNRYFLTEFMASAQALGAAQQRPVRSMLLVLADLDHFKRINDEHGHLSGDRVLKAFAGMLQQLRGERDVLVRWGGEEFVWLCLDADAQDGPARCDALRAALRALKTRGDDGADLQVTASFGFVAMPIWPGCGCPWELALRLADHAIYLSKAQGRDRWTGFRGLRAPAPISADLQVLALEAGGHVECLRMPAGG